MDIKKELHMKTNRSSGRLAASVIALFFFLSLYLPAIGSEKETKTYRVIFTAMDDGGAGNYGYLRNSIQNMLMTRLGQQKEIAVVDRVLSAKEIAALEGEKDAASLKKRFAGIDYILAGAMFETTAGLNVQMTLFPLDEELEVLNFTSLSPSENEVIADIEALSAEISNKGFGLESAAQLAASSSAQSGFTTEHPEKLYKKRLYTGTIYDTDFARFAVTPKGSKKRQSVDGEVIAMAVGDIDGKPGDEIVTILGTQLTVYRVEGRLLQKMGEKQLSRRLRLHAVSLGDVDQDGRVEIVVSATERLNISSVLMRWQEPTGFEVVARNLRSYLRVVELPGKGTTLCGQRRGRAKTDLLRPGVSVMAFDDQGRLQQKESLPIPKEVNLFDFSYADLEGDGYHELVVVDQQERLKVYSSSNQLMWVSAGKYGGSRTYIGPSQGTATNEQDRTNFTTDESGDRVLIYVPGRTMVSDMDGDGKDEIVVSTAKMSAIGFFQKLRPYAFTGGTVKGMIWHEGELVEVWSTGTYRGYLADFSFDLWPKDAGSQGAGQQLLANASLYVANIPTSGSFAAMLPGTSDSELSVYELAFTKSVKAQNK